MIECMIALALGMLVIAASTGLLLTAQQTYFAIDDSARMDEAAATALTALGAAIRQAAYVDRSGASAPKPPLNALFGLDNAPSAATNHPFTAPSSSTSKPVNGSDVLITRFMATDTAGKPDPNMLNCAGSVLAGRVTRPDRDNIHNWSIFYIGRDTSTREPELFCKYAGKDKQGTIFGADAIARGVESMQLLYGLDRNGDGLPETFLQAAAIAEGDWRKVTAVSIALSIRGAAPTTTLQPETSSATHVRHLFGARYSAQHAAGDPGVSLNIARFKSAERNRTRRIVHGIVMLRNGNAPRRPAPGQ